MYPSWIFWYDKNKNYEKYKEVTMEVFDYEKQHLETLRQSLAECTVLLKSNGDFPLAAAGKFAAYGSGVR